MLKRCFIESFIDVGTGLILAILIQLYIFPFFGLHPTILDSIGIALIFTVVSIIRSAFWRNFFRKIKLKLLSLDPQVQEKPQLF